MQIWAIRFSKYGNIPINSALKNGIAVSLTSPTSWKALTAFPVSTIAKIIIIIDENLNKEFSGNFVAKRITKNPATNTNNMVMTKPSAIAPPY